MGQIESTLNVAMAEVMENMRAAWEAQPEQTGALSGGRPDIVLREAGALPVIIENEFEPARDVDKEARGRLGKHDKKSGTEIRAVIAVKVPRRVREMDTAATKRALPGLKFRYAVYQPERYPEDGWLAGSLADIAFAAQLVSVPTENVAEYVRILGDSSKRIVDVICRLDSGIQAGIAQRLNQAPDEQTWGMAALILSNAMVFYDDLVGTYEIGEDGSAKKSKRRRGGETVELPTIQSMKIAGVVPLEYLITAWRDVLKVNYYAIFHVAIDILSCMSDADASNVIAELVGTTSAIKAGRMSRSADMYGMLLQRLIVDRKHLAAYYTLPQSAALMATVALPPPGDRLYRNMLKFRVGDFACGTGLLLTSVYRQMASNYEAATGKSAADIHERMMSDCINGLDVLPSAAHMAVSALAGMFPKRIFKKTNIHVMPIGRWGKGKKEYRLGSCDLIDGKDTTLFESSRQITGSGEAGAVHHGITDESMDLIVMNPPFTRAGKREEDSVVGSWAAFGASAEDQKAMGKLAAEKFGPVVSHGHAGLASYFVAISHKKIRVGGTVSLILPATIAMGESWKAVRTLLNKAYELLVISIARTDMKAQDGAFSSDTGMGEVMLFARKLPDGSPPVRAKFVSLRERPTSAFDAVQVGDAIRGLGKVHCMEDGNGATSLMVGNRTAGAVIDAELADRWTSVNVVNLELLQEFYSLTRGGGFVALERVCEFGSDSQMLIGKQQKGPFKKLVGGGGGGSPKYPALWNNNSAKQTGMRVEPDSHLEIRPGMGDKAKNMWPGEASHMHMNIDVDYTAQALLASYTDPKTAGGSSWPSVVLGEAESKALIAWFNSTLGVISYWMVAGRQQLGRGRTKRSGLALMQVPDVANCAKAAKLAKIFDRFSGRKLCPINRLDADPVRKELDAAVAGALGITADLDRLRAMLCSEPTIRGECRQATKD